MRSECESWTFFEPVELHLQFAKLAVHQLRLPMRGQRLGASLAFTQ